jgi:hypothetical protein
VELNEIDDKYNKVCKAILLSNGIVVKNVGEKDIFEQL